MAVTALSGLVPFLIETTAGQACEALKVPSIFTWAKADVDKQVSAARQNNNFTSMISGVLVSMPMDDPLGRGQVS